MALSAFDEKSKKPTSAALQTTLGRANTHWNNLIAHVADEYAPLEQVWNFSGEKWGWSLRLIRKRRVILYMTPGKGHFLVGFVLGDRAVAAVRAAGLPDPILAVINSAPKYGEGAGFRVGVRKKADLDAVKKLAAIKMAN